MDAETVATVAGVERGLHLFWGTHGLVETYAAIKGSIVAFAATHYIRREGSPDPVYPFIVGTGFFVSDKLVATNEHVIRAFGKLPRPPGVPPTQWPVRVQTFTNVPGFGVLQIDVPVRQVHLVEKVNRSGIDPYSPEKPDVGLVEIEGRGFPAVELELDPSLLQEGVEVATSGYPMGELPLVAPGYVHQVSPTLQKGVVGAVLPFPGSPPHSYLVNIMAQGGASGSPVFRLDSPRVVGVLYAGLRDVGMLQGGVTYEKPTNFALVVPARAIAQMVKQLEPEMEQRPTVGVPDYREELERLLRDPSALPESPFLRKAEPLGEGPNVRHARTASDVAGGGQGCDS
jgi:hypothetical protein